MSLEEGGGLDKHKTVKVTDSQNCCPNNILCSWLRRCRSESVSAGRVWWYSGLASGGGVTMHGIRWIDFTIFNSHGMLMWESQWISTISWSGSAQRTISRFNRSSSWSITACKCPKPQSATKYVILEPLLSQSNRASRFILPQLLTP